jgi:hypothetical protein
MRKISILLFIIGLLITIFTAFSFFTKENVVSFGKVEITRDKSHTLNWSPLIGIAVMAGSGIMFWLSYKNK